MTILFRDRSERGKLRFSGPQRAWFLHQILTRSFEDIAPGEYRDAAMITAHGRMIGFLEVYALEDHLLAHFEAGLRSTFPEALERYVFATQVEIEDVTEEMALVALVGEGWGPLAGEVAPGSVTHPSYAFGAPAGYLWLSVADKDRVMERLAAAGAEPAEEGQLEEIRIAHGVPRWGLDMDTKTIPQEVGLDAWAVDYDKGCYLGQEAMAKIHFRGKPNRRLARLDARGVEPGGVVSLDGAKVGTVTSVAEAGALAIVKHTVEPGTEVEVQGVPAVVAT